MWCLNQLALGGTSSERRRDPGVVFMDADQVIRNSVQRVFPDSLPIICLFHEKKTLQEHGRRCHIDVDEMKQLMHEVSVLYSNKIGRASCRERV